MNMNNGISTSFELLAAQNAGGNANAITYGMMAPGITVAIAIVIILLALGLLSWLFDFITDHDDYYVP